VRRGLKVLRRENFEVIVAIEIKYRRDAYGRNGDIMILI
jgi:hypothetical protein